MTATPAPEVWARWSPDGKAPAIEYDRGVFEEIRTLVIDGYNRVSHGGIEVGGVLFGDRSDAGIRIRAFRELGIEHKFGPSFSLSEKDEQKLEDLLDASRNDPELTGLAPVGWYHSHTRSDIHFSARDLAVHERFFPEAWQVALVLKPHQWDPVRAAFFLRGADGAIAQTPADPEFELAPPKKLPSSEALPADAQALVWLPAAIEPVVSRRRRIRPALVGIAALLAIAFVVAALLATRGEEAPFRVALADSNGSILVSWDGAAHTVQRATSATLDISDGSEAISVRLTPAQIRRGSLTYTRNSRTVTVRLRIFPESGSPVEDLASLIGPAPPKPVVSPPREPAPEPAAPLVAATKEAAPPEPAVIRPRRFVPPPLASRAATNTTVLGEAPQISGVESRNLALRLPAVPRLPMPSAEAPQRRSGRIIWTGQLRRREFLAIDGNHSSTGFLNGQLPLVPIRIRVSPVDLTGEGWRIYTADPALHGRLEPPGPQNGWNPARFLVDPKLAGGLRVVEAPAAQNEWKRVVLQSVTRDESAVIIQWETL